MKKSELRKMINEEVESIAGKNLNKHYASQDKKLTDKERSNEKSLQKKFNGK